jgi:hypothetical protein
MIQTIVDIASVIVASWIIFIPTFTLFVLIALVVIRIIERFFDL